MPETNFLKEKSIMTLGIIIITILSFYFTSIYTFNLTSCFSDPLFNLFYPINRYLKNNNSLKNVFLIINGLMFDSINIYFWTYFFAYKGNYIIGILVFAWFFFTRQFNYFLFLFPIPKTNIFSDPHFSSLVVPYKLTNDYYYSGHCGNMLFYVLIFYTFKKTFLFRLTLIFLIYTIILLIVYSAHYTIDILIGLIVMFMCFYLLIPFRYKFKSILLRLAEILLNLVDSKLYKFKKNIILDEESKKFV